MPNTSELDRLPRDPVELARRVQAWLTSPEGQRNLREALQRATEATDELERLRKIDRNTLHDPVTV